MEGEGTRGAQDAPSVWKGLVEKEVGHPGEESRWTCGA